jgi:hypothetical protein
VLEDPWEEVPDYVYSRTDDPEDAPDEAEYITIAFERVVASGRLWRDFVPVAFHVDYWDRLGWKDPLGSPAYSSRQRRYAAEWGARSIYTPGFVLQGREWRSRDLGDVVRAKGTGALSVSGELPGRLNVDFSAAGGEPWVANAAILGSGIGVDVKRGENAGRYLAHDFAVLEWRTAAVAEGGHATLDFADLPDTHGAKRLAVAVWIERAGSPVPLQSAGGWMD